MVKRYADLYPQIVDFENLYHAYRKAAKGKRNLSLLAPSSGRGKAVSSVPHAPTPSSVPSCSPPPSSGAGQTR
jgi:hypothetical protein